jgi:hypothetical protein
MWSYTGIVGKQADLENGTHLPYLRVRGIVCGSRLYGSTPGGWVKRKSELGLGPGQAKSFYLAI